jgi:hypothetical protein
MARNNARFHRWRKAPANARFLKGFGIAMLVMVVLGLAVVAGDAVRARLWPNDGDRVRAVMDTLADDLHDHDLDGAYHEMSAEFRARVTLDEFRAQASHADALASTTTIGVTAVARNAPGAGEASGTLTTPGGERPYELAFVIEGDRATVRRLVIAGRAVFE